MIDPKTIAQWMRISRELQRLRVHSSGDPAGVALRVARQALR